MSRSDATAMRHARAIAESMGGVAQYAGKRVVRTKDGRIFTASEDLFGGCFDLALIRPPEPTLLVQVTTQERGMGGGAVTARKRKIENLFLSRLRDTPHEDVELWAWVKRKHMRRWTWNGVEWVELEPITPLKAQEAA